MPARLIGTDSDDPWLPDVVKVHAVQSKVDDVAGNFASIDVEGALAELVDLVDTITVTGGSMPAASGAETIAGVSTTKAVTPNSLAFERPYLDVRTFGAVGDGVTDDTAAIQAAINAAAGRTVYLPAGTYLLNGPRQGPYNALLTFGSNTHIAGDGDASTLKLADGYTTAGDYRIIAPAAAAATDHVTFEHFRIDANAANNLVLGSSGANIRQGYVVFVWGGADVVIDDVTVENAAGRNVFVLGNNLSASITAGRVSNCHIYNVGGAVAGNHLQNDHSSIYTQFADGIVSGNTLANAAPFDPSTPATRTVAGMEIHGSRTLVINNHVTNYTHGGNAVAGAFESVGNTWIGNHFAGLTKLGVALWSLFPNTDLTIAHNVFQMYTDLNTVTGGVYQFNASSGTVAGMTNLTIAHNTIYSNDTTPRSAAWHGVFLTAVDGAKIVHNTFRNTQGAGVNIESHTQAALHVSNVLIANNLIINAGFHTLVNRLWAISLINAGAFGNRFTDIAIHDNRITKTAVITQGRGLSIQGAGRIANVTFTGLDKIANIANITQLVAATGSAMINVALMPKVLSATTATAPTSGLWLKGDQVLHSDVAAAGTLGKVCTTVGAAVEAVWAASTAYTAGQWIRTSLNRVMECAVSGTSGTTEPAPATLGELIVDGGVTWCYRNNGLAVFKTFGAVAA
jgi:hypothetical protein